jgi:hypothetical protein
MKKTILSFLLASIISVSFSQKDDWIRIFWEPEVSNNTDLIETYDHGYIILANIFPESTVSKWGWMIKTNINGELLWSKKIGDGTTWVSFITILQTDDGGYLLSGGTTSVVELNGDPFYIKLNACGEKEWCKVFHSETPYDFGIRTYQVPGEDAYISLVSSWGNVGPGTEMQGIWLFKINNYGEIIWMKNIFDQVHPDAWNEMPKNMFLAQEEKLIIYGFTLFGLPTGSIKPFIVSANPDSTENWWYIIDQNQDLYGELNHAIEDNVSNIYATGWLIGNEPGASYFPAIHKLNKFGDLIYSKQFMDSTEQANAYCVNLLNDTIIDVAGVWNYEGQPFYNSIARLDTSGNFLFEKQITQSDYSFSNTIETFDGKDLYAGPFLEGGFTKIHLYKFNSDLDYDSIYTQPFEYDYMCDDLPIVSDTIGIDDCDIWTSLPGDIEFHQLQSLVVYPNPAREKVKIKLPWATAVEQPFGPMTSRHYNLKYFENSVLRIYDVFGKQLMEIPLKDQQESELEINISSFPEGIYLINLYENNKKIASGKFIKK